MGQDFWRALMAIITQKVFQIFPENFDKEKAKKMMR